MILYYKNSEKMKALEKSSIIFFITSTLNTAFDF